MLIYVKNMEKYVKIWKIGNIFFISYIYHINKNMIIYE
jgi:hypothetical protein